MELMHSYWISRGTRKARSRSSHGLLMIRYQKESIYEGKKISDAPRPEE
jgi:hypothetical protein